MNKVLKLLIADDHLLFIEGLTLILKNQSNLEIVAVAHDGRELLELTHKHLPDIVLLDINMPKMNGLEAIKHLRLAHRKISLIVLSTYNEEHLIEKTRSMGANGYLLKNSSKEELLQAIRLVSEGQSCFPHRISATPQQAKITDNFLAQFNLTKRESEIIQLIKQNHTNQKISEKLSLSIYTVETHRKNIMQKLHLKNPAALIRFILENNI